jgi:hypothetical protein
MMVRVTLQFPDIEALTKFQESVSLPSFTVIPARLQITCTCESEVLLKAINIYEGKVISEKAFVATNK